MEKKSSPPVPDTNRRWWVHITNGSGTGGDGPAITNDLNPTVPKTVGDVLLEPAVIGVAVVVCDVTNETTYMCDF